MTSKRIVAWIVLIFSCTLTTVTLFRVSAKSDDSAPSEKIDKRYADAVKAAHNKDYKKAIEILDKLVKEKPNDADVHNMLGYSLRKSGNKDLGMTEYQRALVINPAHLGALEYQGELFLELKDLKNAKSNLTKLEKICGKSCTEYKTLSTAIESFLRNDSYQY